MAARKMRYFSAAIGLAAASALSLTSSAGAAEETAKTSEAYFVQGVPGVSVDVTVDGNSIGSDVAAREVVGPLDMAEGSHSITVTAAAWSVTSAFKVSDASVDVVVHWPADSAGVPDVTVFDNDITPVVAGKGRLTIAHTAVVPPADVRVDKKVLFANIANGEFVTANVPAMTYSVDIVPTGASSDLLLGPVDLRVKPAALTRVFAIGEPTDGSMAVVIQVLPLGETGSPAPDTVDAGSAGLVASSAGKARFPDGGQFAALTCLAGLLGALLWVTVRRRPGS